MAITTMDGLTWIDNTTSSDSCLLNLSESNIHKIEFLLATSKYLWLVVAPVLVLVGTIGNSMSLVILNTKSFRGTGTSFVLCSLAFVDTAVLYIGAFIRWVGYVSNHDIRSRTLISCKVYMFALLFLSQLSSWTVVQVTIGRAILACCPFRAKKLCSRRNMVSTWVTLVVVIFLLELHCFWTANLVPKRVCSLYNKMNNVDSTVRCSTVGQGSWKDIIVWGNIISISALPALVIITTNAVIVYRLTNRPKGVDGTDSSPGPRQGGRSQQKWNSVSRMLVTVSVVFLVTTLPTALFFSYMNLYPPVVSASGIPQSASLLLQAERHLVYTCTRLLYYTNNAINFFLYVLSGRSFRRALVGVLGNRSRGHNRYGDSASTTRGLQMHKTNLLQDQQQPSSSPTPDGQLICTEIDRPDETDIICNQDVHN